MVGIPVSDTFSQKEALFPFADIYIGATYKISNMKSIKWKESTRVKWNLAYQGPQA